MTKKDADRILQRIAEKNHVPLHTVRTEILKAMEAAQQNTDPRVQARWASIPKKGKDITIEEFLDYAVKHMETFLY